MKKILILLIIIYLLFPSIVSADMISPEWFDKRCEQGEIQVTCSTPSNYYPDNPDNCKVYKDSSDYYLLISSGKGDSKYCLKTGGTPIELTEEKNNDPSQTIFGIPMRYLWVVIGGVVVVILVSVFLLIRMKK